MVRCTCKCCHEIQDNMKQQGCCKTIFGASDTELRRLWYTALYTLISFFFIGMFNVIAQKRGVAHDAEGPISDLGFDLLYPFTIVLLDFNPWICDQFTYVMVGLVIAWILIFMGRKNKGYESRVVVLKRWMLLISFLFNIRCITIISTILPRPWSDDEEWKYCNDETSGTTFSWNVALGTFEYMANTKNVCYDFFYSGHTMMVTLMAMIVTKYSHCIYFKIIIWLMAIFTMISVIAVRAHYTIDVWGGLIITILLFQLFDMQVMYKHGIFAKLEKDENRYNNNNMNQNRNGDGGGEDDHNTNENGNITHNQQTNQSASDVTRFTYYLF